MELLRFIMVREEFREKHFKRLTFEGIFKQFGKKRGYKGYLAQTILLIDVKEFQTEKVLTDHLWFNSTLRFKKLELSVGDIVKFDGRVRTYRKGYAENSHYYYKISHPSKISIIGYFEFVDKDDLRQYNADTVHLIETHNNDLHDRRKNYMIAKETNTNPMSSQKKKRKTLQNFL